MSQLNQEKEKYKQELKSIETINGEFENNILNAESDGIKHTLIGIGAIVMGVAIYKTFLQNNE